MKDPIQKFSDPFLSSVFETVIDSVIVIDEDGIIIKANQASVLLFGHTKQELIGSNVSILMDEPHQSKHNHYLKRYLSSRKPQIIGIGREVMGKKKSGALFPIRLAVSETIVDGKHYFTGIIHDLTNLKKAEQSFIELNEELEIKVKKRTEELSSVVNQLLETNQKLKFEINERQKVESSLRDREVELKSSLSREKDLNELKSRFVSAASHEFRTPLSTILSSANLIQRYSESDQQLRREKHIHKIKNSVAYLNSILNDFLSLSKIEEDKISLKTEQIKINQFSRDIIEELETILKHDQYFIFLPLEEEYELHSDRTILRTLYYNLVSNASKYSGEGKPIQVSLKNSGSHLKIEIKDEGIGIPREDQKHLFGRFVRAQNVTAIQGTGLGLHIVKRYVDLLYGTIEFQSDLGKGSIFTINLPLK